MHASSLCIIIGTLCLGVSWAQKLGNWQALGGDVKGGGFQYLGAMYLPAEDQASCIRPKITVQISTKGPRIPKNLAVILFDDKQESFAQIGRSFTHSGKYTNFCENTVESSKTFHTVKRKTLKRKTLKDTRHQKCGWTDNALQCGDKVSCTKGFRVEKFGKTTRVKDATARDSDTYGAWQTQRIEVSQQQARTWYFAIAQCGDEPMMDFKFRISSDEALPIPEANAPTDDNDEEDDDEDAFWGGYVSGAIGGAGSILTLLLIGCFCSCVIRMCVRKKKTSESKKKAVVPVGAEEISMVGAEEIRSAVAKVVAGDHHTTVVVGHAVQDAAVV